jgi:anti-anti-sigma regulatory factor
MNSDDPPSDSLSVATTPDTAFVRVRGRGSYKTGPVLKEFENAVVARGCQRFLFDMAECVGMDSTFMGILAGMAMRAQRRDGGEVIVLNLNQKTENLLVTLGLDRVLAVHRAGQAPTELDQELAQVSGLAELEQGRTDSAATAETMLAAHEDLVKAAPASESEFKDVIRYLKEEVQRFHGTDEGVS